MTQTATFLSSILMVVIDEGLVLLVIEIGRNTKGQCKMEFQC